MACETNESGDHLGAQLGGGAGAVTTVLNGSELGRTTNGDTYVGSERPLV